MFLESKDHYNWTPYNNIKICLFYRDWLAVISPFILLKLLKWTSDMAIPPLLCFLALLGNQLLLVDPVEK